jgi:phosphoribosylamine-glycine ligase
VVRDRGSDAAVKNIDVVLAAGKTIPLISMDAVQIERSVRILIAHEVHLSPQGEKVIVVSRLEGNQVDISVMVAVL